MRELGDGEKTFGFVDIEGRYNPTMLGGFWRAFVFAREMKTMTTGCINYEEARVSARPDNSQKILFRK